MLTNEKDFIDKATSPEYNLPQHTVTQLKDWHFMGVMPGDFLRGVLSNNLHDAFSRADSENLRALPRIVKFLYNQMPTACHQLSNATSRIWAWQEWKGMNNV